MINKEEFLKSIIKEIFYFLGGKYMPQKIKKQWDKYVINKSEIELKAGNAFGILDDIYDNEEDLDYYEENEPDVYENIMNFKDFYNDLQEEFLNWVKENANEKILKEFTKDLETEHDPIELFFSYYSLF